MPSHEHELLLHLVTEEPLVLAALLPTLVGPNDILTSVPGTYADLVATEYRADAAMLVGRPPRRALVVEVQLKRDERKRWSWPVYVTTLQARAKVPAQLVVLTISANVATWARGPFTLADGVEWRPCVLGPEDLIRMVTPERAESVAELGVLSLMAHARARRIPSETLGRATLEGISNAQARLAEDTLRLHSDAALTAIAGSLKLALENDMDMTNWKPQSAYHQRLEKVEAELKALVAERDATAAERDATAAERDATAAERDATAAERDATATKAVRHAQDAVRSVLDARGLPPDAAMLRLLDECTDLDQLHAWLQAAITADSVGEVFKRDEHPLH